jgi:hypothetical protein
LRNRVDASTQQRTEEEDPVVHVYQDAEVLRSRFWDHPIVDFLGFGSIALFLLGLFAFAGGSFTLQAAGPFVGFIGVLLVAIYAGQRRQQYGVCGEIRLDDDGTCELQTKRGVIRLHVSEIRSVKYWRDSESGTGNFTLYYQDGELLVTGRMTGFPDFLTRLATLNPVADLTTFPAFLADARPGLHTPATKVSGINMSRLVRSAVFPVFVIVLLAWLAIQTLLGK